MTIIQSEHNKIFGGFFNEKFDTKKSQYFNDFNAFLFSLTTKKKFKVIKPEYALYANADIYIDSFGGGHDIKIGNNCDQNTNSASNFGLTY